MRSRHPGMSPEKIAIAVAVTMAAIAGIGAMKKVTGTSSAVAIVAVSPGTAPTNRPNSDAPIITKMLYGSNTIEKACAQAPLMASTPLSPRPPCQHAPGQRHLQQLVERVMDQQRHHDRHRNGHDPADPQHPHERRKVKHAGED